MCVYVEGTIRMSSVDRSRKIHKFTFKKFTYRDIIKFLLSKENVLHAHCSFYIYTSFAWLSPLRFDTLREARLKARLIINGQIYLTVKRSSPNTNVLPPSIFRYL